MTNEPLFPTTPREAATFPPLPFSLVVVVPVPPTVVSGTDEVVVARAGEAPAAVEVFPDEEAVPLEEDGRRVPTPRASTRAIRVLHVVRDGRELRMR